MTGLLLIIGAVVIFIFTRREFRLIFPFGICVLVATLGMVLFLLVSGPPADPSLKAHSLPVMALVMAGAGFYGMFLIGIVWVSRLVTARFMGGRDGGEG